MRKMYFLFLLAAGNLLCKSGSCFAGEDTSLIGQRLVQRPSRIYFGPELLGIQIDTHMKGNLVDGSEFFWGLRLGYEYLKPNAFYAAAELLATVSTDGFSVENKASGITGSSQARFGSIQTRFGYTASGQRYLISPYLGLSVYSLSKRTRSGFKEHMGVLSGGARTQFACNSVCAVGLNAEVFWTLGGLQETIEWSKTKTKKHHKGFGGSLGIPLTIRLSRGWDMQISPYYLRLLFSENQNVYGNSILFGYRF